MPKNLLTKRVRRAFDAEALKRICVQTDFSDYADYYVVEGKDHRFYWYQDNGSDILAIAHLDSVHDDGTCRVVNSTSGLAAFSGALDDRLGAYVILELLPAMGIKCDWLLTTDEEKGQSTAELFTTEKKYNWMFSFDRGGTDVVSYTYETAELNAMIRDTGAATGIGSFSDICELEHLGCKGMNWGVGYRDYHGPHGYAFLHDTFGMVAKFIKFHQNNAETLLYHEPYVYIPNEDRWDGYFSSSTPNGYFAKGKDGFSKWYNEETEFCPACDDDLIDEFCRRCGIDWASDAPVYSGAEGWLAEEGRRDHDHAVAMFQICDHCGVDYSKDFGVEEWTRINAAALEQLDKSEESANLNLLLDDDIPFTDGATEEDLALEVG